MKYLVSLSLKRSCPLSFNCQLPLLDDSVYLKSKSSKNEKVNYLLVSENFQILKDILSQVENDKNIIEYQLKVSNILEEGGEYSINDITSLFDDSVSESIFFILREMCFGNDNYLVKGDWSLSLIHI